MTLAMRCQVCRTGVAGSETATLHLDHSDVQRYLTEHSEWEQRCRESSAPFGMLVITGDLLLNEPHQPAWQIHCDRCNPHRGEDGGLCEGCYWISLDRCATESDLLRWTAHLMGKQWFQYTAWDQLIYRSIERPSR